jgi:hypothetical protein
VEGGQVGGSQQTPEHEGRHVASDTGLHRAELDQALIDPEHGLSLELRG